MRNIRPLSLSLLALATLSACGGPTEETINETYADPMAEDLQNAAPVELPPPLKMSETYRCKDNSLVFIDFFVGDTQANIRTEEGGTPTRLTAPEAGQPFTAEGFSVEGSGETVTVATPDKPAQSCKA